MVILLFLLIIVPIGIAFYSVMKAFERQILQEDKASRKKRINKARQEIFEDYGI